MHTDTHMPGEEWLDILRRPTLAGFAAAFTDDVTLCTSTGTAALHGTSAVRHFFDATRAMYDSIAFVAETRSDRRTVLEWEGVFQGAPIAGATILSHDQDGKIADISLYHRPFRQVIAFAAALATRLEGKIDAGIFLA